MLVPATCPASASWETTSTASCALPPEQHPLAREERASGCARASERDAARCADPVARLDLTTRARPARAALARLQREPAQVGASNRRRRARANSPAHGEGPEHGEVLDVREATITLPADLTVPWRDAAPSMGRAGAPDIGRYHEVERAPEARGRAASTSCTSPGTRGRARPRRRALGLVGSMPVTSAPWRRFSAAPRPPAEQARCRGCVGRPVARAPGPPAARTRSRRTLSGGLCRCSWRGEIVRWRPCVVALDQGPEPQSVELGNFDFGSATRPWSPSARGEARPSRTGCRSKRAACGAPRT